MSIEIKITTDSIHEVREWGRMLAGLGTREEGSYVDQPVLVSEAVKPTKAEQPVENKVTALHKDGVVKPQTEEPKEAKPEPVKPDPEMVEKRKVATAKLKELNGFDKDVAKAVLQEFKAKKIGEVSDENLEALIELMEPYFLAHEEAQAAAANEELLQTEESEEDQQAEESSKPKYSIAELRTLAVEKTKADAAKKAKMKEILSSIGASGVSSVPEDKIDEVYEQISGL